MNSISTKTLVTLCVVGVIVLFGFGYGCTALGYRSDCVASETGLKAQQEQVKNNYDNMWKRFLEMSQVPSMYVKNLKLVFDSAMQGRYGKDGSKSVFSSIQEHNPTIDSSMYTKSRAPSRPAVSPSWPIRSSSSTRSGSTRPC